MRDFCRTTDENWTEVNEIALLLNGQYSVFIFNPRLIQLMFQKFSVKPIANLCGEGNSILNH